MDGVGSADGRLQLGAAGNAAEHGSHRQVICGVAGIVVKAPPDSLVVFPNPLPSALSSRLLSIGMEWIPMHSIPIQSIANAFHRNGTHTIGIDTNGVDAHGVGAAGGRVAGTTWLFRWRIGGKTAARGEKPAPMRAAKGPFTHGCSPRDNRRNRGDFLNGADLENVGSMTVKIDTLHRFCLSTEASGTVAGALSGTVAGALSGTVAQQRKTLGRANRASAHATSTFWLPDNP